MDKRLLIIPFLLIVFISSACGLSFNVDISQGSGNVTTETREVSNFDRVSLSGIGDLNVVQGEDEILSIEAEDNIIDNITAEVKDGTLYIGYDRKTILPTKPIKFHLTMLNIHGLETKGVSNIQADLVQTDRLDIGISGTGNVNIQNLETGNLDVTISGAGNLTGKGQATQQTVNLSGAGNYDAVDIQSKDADITITGLGKVTVWVTDNLNVTISGTGGVDYYGSPQVSQRISGLGKLNRLGSK